jgi:hypothetical protein
MRRRTLAPGTVFVLALLLAPTMVIPALATGDAPDEPSSSDVWTTLSDFVTSAQQRVEDAIQAFRRLVTEALSRFGDWQPPTFDPGNWSIPNPSPDVAPQLDDWTDAAWAHDPLTIAIQWEEGVDPQMRTLVQAAITEWQVRLRERADVDPGLPAEQPPFGVRYVGADQADILFVLRHEAEGKALGDTGVLYAGDVVLTARIEMAVDSANGLPLDDADVQTIAAHEFGHALGPGHSADPEDLMYYEYDVVRSGRAITPSSCDIDWALSVYQTDGFDEPNTPSAVSGFTCA